MGVMTAVDTAGRFSRADFEALPDGDGRRYELLDAAVPDDLEVFFAPLDAYLPTRDILEPEVLVIDKRIVVEDKVEGSPILAVEAPYAVTVRPSDLSGG